MCLAIPAKITEIKDDFATCQVGESQTFISVSLMLMEDEVAPGDYLIVHAGFALRKLSQEDAHESLNVLRQMVEAQGDQAGF